MKTDRISFTSKINFVDLKTFDKNFRKGKYIECRENGNDIVIAPEFFTEQVRTCSGMVLKGLLRKVAGCHRYDNETNYNNLPKFLHDLFEVIKAPDSAIIIGGKDLSDSIYSMPIFKGICEGVKERVPKVTIFGQHRLPWSESHFHYSAKEDTMTINSMYRPLTDYREHQVLSKEDLYKAFEYVELADCDTLYIDGKQIFL